jgi:hypothetical protein
MHSWQGVVLQLGIWAKCEQLLAVKTNISCYKTFTWKPSKLDWHSCMTKQWKKDLRFGTWNFWSLYFAGSHAATTRKLALKKLYLMGVQQVSWGQEFAPVQTGPGAHPVSCTMGTRYFPGVKCGQGMLLTTHPLLSPRFWKCRAILLPSSGPQPDQ